jgi:NADPH:quinone reductase-like Zn-dependent oxidoreductase
VGTQVTRFKPGDEIVSPTGLGGAYAEYLCLKGNHAAFKPLNVSHTEAATVSVGGLNALHLMRTAEIEAGQRVLLNGAGGCIGTVAIQLAKNLGAEVTAVDSTEKLPVLKSIGADHVIDYTQQDFTQNGETYDVIIDIVGKSSYSRSLRSLQKDGYFVLANAPTSHLIRSLWSRVFGSRRVRPVLTSYKAEDLACLMELLEAGKLKPVIDRRYPLSQAADAHGYVDSGRKTGNVVLTVSA